MTPFRAHLLLLLVGLQVCGQAAAVPAAPVQRLPRPDEGHDPAPPFVRPDDPLLVSLLDGSLAALDSETGEQLWRFDSGSPLVSASGTASKQQAGRRPHTIFPGADGALYSYHSDGALERGVERLPLSVPELVDGSPSMSRDGALVLGSRTSSVYILDSSTGKLVRALLEFGGTLAEVDSYIGGPPGEGEVRKVVDPQNALIMGRHDYVIRSVDAETGEERWNVTYARMQRLTPPRRDQGQEWPDLAGPLDQLGPTEAGLLGMAAGPDNTLVRYDPLSGEARWTVSFNTPAVAAYTSLGIGLLLHGQQGMPALPNDVLAAGHPPRDQASLGAVMVGSLRGSLYALPASHWTPPPALVPADWEKGSDLVGQAGAAGGEGQLVALSLDHARDDDSLWTCPLGMHSINETPPQRQFFLPSAAQPNAQRANELREPKDHLRRSAPHVSGRSWLHVAGAGVAGAAIAWLINYIYWSGKPKATATMTHPAEGVTQMTVDYSGTQQDMQRQREETDVTFPAPDDSKIRDATGSGLENIPEQGVFEPDPTKPNGRRKKARNPRFSNRMNGVLQQSDAQNMAQPSANGSVAQSLNVQNALSEDMIGRASLASNGHDRVSNSSGSSGSGTSSTIRAREERDGVIYVGRMQVFKSEELGRGSNGTIVYGGSLEGRRVAVKRMQVEFVDQARKEIGVLVLSDEHPNVIRCFAMEEDSEFVYLALERCRDSLADRLSPAGQPHAFVAPDGLPTQFAMQIAEDVGRGLLALHERGIVHRDLKPHNVLLTEGRRAKLSDMGLCKQLVPEQSSFDSAGAGGSSGWQAPETMVSRSGGDMRLGKGVDVFSFGLILFYCLTGGRHAFGEFYEREWNILQGRPNLRPIQHMAEAHNLIAALLAKDPKKRPSMRAVMAHPMWWPPATRLAFLIHTSDRVENEDREEDQTLLRVLERCAPDAVGQDWAARLEGELLANLGRYRKYNRSSLRDLLRVVRNKHNHFREMPEALQHKLAPVPEGFLGYFTSRFPQLLLTTYAFALHHCAHEPPLNRYFAEGAHDFAFVADPAGPAAKPRPEPLSAGLPVISERAGSAPATASANEESAQPPLQDNERAKSAPVPNVAIPAVPEQTHEPKSMYSSGPSLASSPSKPGSSSSEGDPDARSSISEPPPSTQPAGQDAGCSTAAAIWDPSPTGATGRSSFTSSDSSGGRSATGSVAGSNPGFSNSSNQGGNGSRSSMNGGSHAPCYTGIYPAAKSPAQASNRAAPRGASGPGFGIGGLFSGLLGSPLHGRRASQESLRPPEAVVAESLAVAMARDGFRQDPAAPPPGAAFGGQSPPSGPGKARFFGKHSPSRALAAQQAQQQALLQAHKDAQRVWEASGSSSSADVAAAAPCGYPGGPLAGPAPASDTDLASYLEHGSYHSSFTGSLGGSSGGAMRRATDSSSTLASLSRISPAVSLSRVSPAPSLNRASPSPSGGSFSRSPGPPAGLAASSSMQNMHNMQFMQAGWAQPPPPPPASAPLPQTLSNGMGFGSSMWAADPFGCSASLVRKSWPGAAVTRHEQDLQAPAPPALQRASMGSSRVDADRLKGPGFDNFFPPELGITEAEIDRCIEDAEGAITVFPQRPGHPVCDFFMKTGHCKFNEQCKFDHPRRYAVKLNKGGLPLRPCEAVCGFYERTGQCKFGPACKFHHPQYEEGHQFGETAALSAFAGGEAGRPRKQGEGKRRSHDT